MNERRAVVRGEVFRLRCNACGCLPETITPLCNGRAVLHDWKPETEVIDRFLRVFKEAKEDSDRQRMKLFLDNLGLLGNVDPRSFH